MLFEKFFLRLCLYDFTFYKPRFFALITAFLRLKRILFFEKPTSPIGRRQHAYEHLSTFYIMIIMMIFLKNDHYKFLLFCKSGFPADILKNFTFFQKKNHPFFRSTTFFRPSYVG